MVEKRCTFLVSSITKFIKVMSSIPYFKTKYWDIILSLILNILDFFLYNDNPSSNYLTCKIIAKSDISLDFLFVLSHSLKILIL